MMSTRTDRNNNPTAFTTDLAKEAGLVEGTDYEQGDSFSAENRVYYTARLLGNPIDITIKLIDKLGFYTTPPHARWTYIAIPYKIWLQLSYIQKKMVIQFMYHQEGGTELEPIFS